MGSSLDSRAHAAMLLRVLADTAADARVSAADLAALAEKIGTHLRDEAATSTDKPAPRPPLKLIEGGLQSPNARST